MMMAAGTNSTVAGHLFNGNMLEPGIAVAFLSANNGEKSSTPTLKSVNVICSVSD